MAGDYFDALEQRTPAEREAELMRKLAGFIAYARAACKRYAALAPLARLLDEIE